MDENEIYEALGMEKPDQSQKEAPEGQEQAREGRESGQNGQEDPERQEGDRDPEDGQEDREEPDKGGEQPPAGQRPGREQQSQVPAVDREALEAAVRQAVARERQRQEQVLADFFRSANLRDPVTGEIIRDMSGLEAYSQAAETRRLERNLAEGKLTPEDIDALIRRRLAQREPQPQKDAAQEAGQTPRTRSVPEVTEEQVAAELAEIHRLDPGVNSLEDILKGPERDAFISAVRRGNSFLDAFRLAGFDRLQQRRQAEAAQRAAQAERNRSRSKEHMVPAGSRGQGASEVPADILELYREIMPGASAEEIQKHYNKFKRGVK